MTHKELIRSFKGVKDQLQKRAKPKKLRNCGVMPKRWKHHTYSQEQRELIVRVYQFTNSYRTTARLLRFPVMSVYDIVQAFPCERKGKFKMLDEVTTQALLDPKLLQTWCTLSLQARTSLIKT